MERIKQERSQEQLAEWVDTFLRGEGNNVPLADGLKKQKRWWIDAAQFPLDKLVRCWLIKSYKLGKRKITLLELEK